MFGPEFKDCWYEIPGAYGLQLSGDLRFKSKYGKIRKMQYERMEGRPCISIQLKKSVKIDGNRWQRHIIRVMLHRAVMSVVLGRELDTSVLVLHEDDDVTNCWPDNLYIGTVLDNTYDAIRNGGITPYPQTVSDAVIAEIRAAYARGERVTDITRAHNLRPGYVSKEEIRCQFIILARKDEPTSRQEARERRIAEA